VLAAARGMIPGGVRAAGKERGCGEAGRGAGSGQGSEDGAGDVDILSIMPGAPWHTPRLEEIRRKDWNLVIDVNLKGTFLCCQAVIPEMARQGKGVIVNMSALAGHWRASLGRGSVRGGKAGVEGLTRSLPMTGEKRESGLMPSRHRDPDR